MKLFIDVGNTALKWRWRRRGDVVFQGCCRHERRWESVTREMLASIDDVELLKSVWVASVGGSAADAQIRHWLVALTGVSPHFYYSQKADKGINSCYSQPRKLGVDRWVAMIEAYRLHGACVVIDCGSALTVDAVDNNGQFLGGYIVPGMGMLRGTLLRDAADIQVESARAALGLGQNTGECVHNGLLRMSVAFVTDVVVELRRRLADTCTVVVTGGNALELVDAFPFEFLHWPDLVLNGLEYVAAQEQ